MKITGAILDARFEPVQSQDPKSKAFKITVAGFTDAETAAKLSKLCEGKDVVEVTKYGPSSVPIAGEPDDVHGVPI